MFKKLISFFMAILMVALSSISVYASNNSYYNPSYYGDSPYDTPLPTRGRGFTNTPQQGEGYTNSNGFWNNYQGNNYNTISYQLNTPYVSANKNINLGEILYMTWNKVESADYYTIHSWTTNECFDDITSTAYSLMFDAPGVYAISVYARSYNNTVFKQSEPYTFNVTVMKNNNYYVSPTNNNSTIINCDYYNTLTNMMSGVLYNGVYKVGTAYTGPRYSEQCKGFARTVHNILFGYDIGSTKSNNYEINISNKNTKMVGQVTSDNDEDYKKMFMNARVGDFVQMKRDNQKGTPHSAIVYYVDDYGVTFYEANTDSQNGIKKQTHTWSDLNEKNKSMSIYTARNY